MWTPYEVTEVVKIEKTISALASRFQVTKIQNVFESRI